jgi:Papain fold toxin 2
VEPAHAIAAAAARGYQVLQCQKCAENVRKELIGAGFHGQIIELRNRGKCEFMVCMGYLRGQTTITETGWHVGVRIGNLVFDNLHPDGMRYDDWVQDFDAIEGVTVSVASDF